MSEHRWKRAPVLWLSVGFCLGLSLAYLWPHAPAHATATDRHENFAIATGPVTGELEAVYLLDNVTGELRAYVLDPQQGRFGAMYGRQIAQDLGVAGGNARYIMVTGIAAIQARALGMQRGSQSVLYVAELTSGNMACYTLPFGGRAAGGLAITDFVLLQVVPFRNVGVRPGGAPPPAP